MNKKDLEIIGAMLYACEGTKARKDKRYDRLIYSIELTNSDARIIKMFCLFLKRILKVDWARVRGEIFYYPDLNEKTLIIFWSKESGIPRNQFQKSILLKAKIKFKPSPYGTFKVRYSCKKDFLRLQAIIDKVWRGA